MKIKRYEIVPDHLPGKFRIIDRLEDDFVSVPLVCNSEKEAKNIMGKYMDELVDSSKVHPDYLKSSNEKTA